MSFGYNGIIRYVSYQAAQHERWLPDQSVNGPSLSPTNLFGGFASDTISPFGAIGTHAEQYL